MLNRIVTTLSIFSLSKAAVQTESCTSLTDWTESPLGTKEISSDAQCGGSCIKMTSENTRGNIYVEQTIDLTAYEHVVISYDVTTESLDASAPNGAEYGFMKYKCDAAADWQKTEINKGIAAATSYNGQLDLGLISCDSLTIQFGGFVGGGTGDFVYLRSFSINYFCPGCTESKLDTAQSRADEAYSLAESASSDADSAQSTADLASSAAGLAQSKADSAYSDAGSAQTKADSAYSLAAQAKKKASSASRDAGSADKKASRALKKIDSVVSQLNDKISSTASLISAHSAVGSIDIVDNNDDGLKFTTKDLMILLLNLCVSTTVGLCFTCWNNKNYAKKSKEIYTISATDTE